MNAKWHIINHLACAVVFLSVCSFSAFSQERDTIFIIEHDTVWMDPQPDAVIESRTRENRYDRRVHRYRRHWEALIPTHTKIQFAGNMGLLSFGTGWDYGRRNQWETDVFFGVLPKYDSKRTKLTFTVKQNYLPWSLQIKQSRFSVEPLAGTDRGTSLQRRNQKRPADYQQYRQGPALFCGIIPEIHPYSHPRTILVLRKKLYRADGRTRPSPAPRCPGHLSYGHRAKRPYSICR